MAIPVLAEIIQAIRTLIDLIPAPVKLLMFLAVLMGGMIIPIPFAGFSFYQGLDYMVSGMGNTFGFDWTIKGFVILVFLGVPTFFVFKYGGVH